MFVPVHTFFKDIKSIPVNCSHVYVPASASKSIANLKILILILINQVSNSSIECKANPIFRQYYIRKNYKSQQLHIHLHDDLIYITCFEMINNSQMTQKWSFSNDELFSITAYHVV